MLRLNCPSCQKQYLLHDDMLGKQVQCKECRTLFAVGSVAPPPPPRPTPREESISERRRPPAGVTRTPLDRRRLDDSSATRRSTLRNRDDEDSPQIPWLWIGAGGGGLVVLTLIVVLIVALGSGSRPVEEGVAQNAPPGARGAVAPPPVAPLPPGPVPQTIAPETTLKVKKATVYLRVSLNGGSVGEGSGFFALEPGIVLTNAHVLGMLQPLSPAPQRIDVVLNSGEPDEQTVPGQILGVDRQSDLAVLRVQGLVSQPIPLTIDSAGTLAELQKVYIFGFPFGEQLGKNLTVSESSVSSLRKNSIGGITKIQVNGGMHPGNSGGPVVDARGVVVGVAVAIIRGTQLHFAVPADLVRVLVQGRVSEMSHSPLSLENNQKVLPLKVTCLDPLQRIREVKVDVWAGSPGPPRPFSFQQPQPQPGDSVHLSVPLTYQNGVASGKVVLPNLSPGQVYWIQPVVVNSQGATQWSSVTPLTATEVARATPGPLTRGRVVLNLQSTLTPLDAVDRFPTPEKTVRRRKLTPVHLRAGVTYIIEANQAPGSQLDPMLTVESATGQQLAFDDDGGGYPNARLVFTPTISGFYRLAVVNYDNHLGAFQLVVTETTN